jgi:hypothetical protein
MQTKQMKRFLALPIMILFSSLTTALAQVPLEVLMGMHYGTNLSQNVEKNLLEQYWEPSLDLGVRSSIPVTGWLNLRPSLLYNHCFFNTYYPTGNYSDTARVFVSSSGEPSNVFRALVELQFIDQSSQFAKPYFVIGGGYIYEHLGTMHGRMEYVQYIKYSKDIKLSDNSYVAYTLGAGGVVTLSTDFVLDFSVKYYSNTTGRSYGLLSLGIGYKLLNGF